MCAVYLAFKSSVVLQMNILSLSLNRWKINEKVIVTDVTVSDKSTGNDLTVTMRESHKPEGFFGGQK